MEGKLLSVSEVADFLKVTKQNVSSKIRAGSILAKKIGNQWIINENDLKRYIKDYNIVVEPEDHPRETSDIPEIVALSFFSGAMGLDIGLEKEGITPLLASEIDKETRKTIHSNKPDIALIGDMERYTAEDILNYAKLPKDQTIDLIYGGPPCQAFSTAGKRLGFDDDRGNVFLSFVRLIGDLKPRYALIENVRGLLSAKYPVVDGGEPVKGGALLYVMDLLKEFGYSVSFELYNSANFGSPQTRERVIMICKLGAEKVPYLSPTNSDQSEYDLPKWKVLREALVGISQDDRDHDYVKFPEKRLVYYRMLSEGQNWRNLPKDVQPKAMGKSFELGGGKTGFYRRLSYDKPSPTLVTNPTMPATDLCHPEKDRPLSIQEYKRIQGFPETWKFCGELTDVYRQIGNAVPIQLGQAVARTILADMRGEALPQFDNFKYSRYKNTNEITFENEMKRIHSLDRG
ncbi:DNA cytosine methyltransferase [Enterococcus xiangfangensis]|uniref:DNA cytosine methyltransferase n=1 Tax=Enterococcus xiangfangensis TaxID=1296537 RepID=UPI0010F93E56|nr:DNA cytosine methyltransferase [Enterococcus xiangfangensis]MBM7712858.1 DNA (cytosine-5)-methyltransferase 1 [Enterococcus xiangfangensis]